jgi:hypothetical protein
MFLLVSNFPNLAIFVGKKMGKNGENSTKNVNNKIIAKNLKGKRLFLMNKNLKLILIISTLNT